MKPRLTYANCMSTIAVFLALTTGGAYAKATFIDGRNIKANSIHGKSIRNATVDSADLKNGAITKADLSPAAIKTLTQVQDTNALGAPCEKGGYKGTWMRVSFGTICAPTLTDATANDSEGTATTLATPVYAASGVPTPSSVEGSLTSGSLDYYRVVIPCAGGNVAGQGSPGLLTLGFGGEGSGGKNRIDALDPGATSPFWSSSPMQPYPAAVCAGRDSDRTIILRVSDDERIPFKYRLDVSLGIGF